MDLALDNTAIENAMKVNIVNVDPAATVSALSGVTTTTTSAEIDCRGFNSIRIEREVTAVAAGTFTCTVTGSEVSGGTFGTIYKENSSNVQTAIALPTIDSVKKEVYSVSGGIPSFIKITETLAGGTGTITTKVTPFNR